MTRRYVRVEHESSLVDRRSGQPYRWAFEDYENVARKHVAKVNAGKMRDPLGRPWPKVRAWIEEGEGEK